MDDQHYTQKKLFSRMENNFQNCEKRRVKKATPFLSLANVLAISSNITLKLQDFFIMAIFTNFHGAKELF